MPTRSVKLRGESGIGLGRLFDALEHLAWQERIIRRGKEQGWDPYVREVSLGAGLLVVVASAQEAMNRRGHGVVEFIDRARVSEFLTIEEIWISRELCECLALERTQETSIVNARESA